VWVFFQSQVAAYSGYHYHHNSQRPKGSFYPEEGQTIWGCVPTTWIAPLVSGAHPIMAVFAHYGAAYATAYVGVGLFELPSANYFNKEGGTPEHPHNHWGTWNAVGGVLAITEEFNRVTGITPHVNDMSLPWGGRFDLGPAYGGVWWGPPHHEHMWGTNADIPYSKLDPYRDTFLQIAIDYGADYLAESTHYHLRFAN